MIRQFRSNALQLRAAYLKDLLLGFSRAVVRLVSGPQATPTPQRIQQWHPSQAAGL